MPDVKANAILPKGEANGLAAIADELLKDPTRKRAALIIFDLRRGTEDYDVSDIVATVRIRRVEPLLPDDLPNAELMIRRAAQARTIGGEQLAFEFEQEIEAAFEAMRDPTSPADPDEPGDPGTIDPPPGDPPDDEPGGKGPRGRGRK
jgi:hypothetical protein